MNQATSIHCHMCLVFLYPHCFSLTLSLCRCHTFGIGANICRGLVTSIAEAGGGRSVILQEGDRLQTKVHRSCSLDELSASHGYEVISAKSTMSPYNNCSTFSACVSPDTTHCAKIVPIILLECCLPLIHYGQGIFILMTLFSSLTD